MTKKENLALIFCPPNSARNVSRALELFKRKLLHFGKESGGNIVMMFGVSVIPLVFATGMAVDYGNSRWIESQVQAAGDMGALAAAATRAAGGGDDGDTITYGKRIFDENKPSKGGGETAEPTITWGNNVVTLVARAQIPSPFLSVMGIKTVPIVTVSKAAYGPPLKPCILALNQDDHSAVKISGESTLDAEKCAVWSNSGTELSMYQVDLATAKASGFCAHGKAVGVFSPKARSRCKRADDPFAELKDSLASYDSLGCSPSDKGLVIQKQDGPVTLDPGVFCGGIDVQTEARVTLRPGTFHIVGQLVVRSQATITGATTEQGGNTLIFYGPKGGFYANGAGKITIEAPEDESNPYSGMALMSDGVNAGYQHTMNGGAGVDITGSVYTPNQDVKVAGDIVVNISASEYTIVADKITTQGSSTLNVVSDNDLTDLSGSSIFVSGDVVLIE
ncbi:MAG: TadE/TadG family type IV pilus assembly protein [bacterium]